MAVSLVVESYRQRTRGNPSQGMQVGQQIVKLLLGKLILKGRHLGAAQHDDIGDPLVIGRHSILHERLLEQPIQARASQVAFAVGVMAIGTARVIHPPAAGLLRVQSQLSIGLAGFGVASTENRDRN